MAVFERIHRLLSSIIVKCARTLLTAVSVLLALCLCACVRRDGRNSDCQWPGEPGATVLDPTQRATARHLSSDTEFAEELADRYTNAHYGPRSGYVGPPRAGAARQECMVKLFQQIGETHGVSTGEVIASFGRNRAGIDVGEVLSFAVLFACLMAVAVRHIWARYPPADGWGAAMLMILLGSLGFAVAAVLIGPLWSMTAENIRIGTGHLGPRVFRLPMEQDPKVVFATCMALFWVIAFIRWPRERT